MGNLFFPLPAPFGVIRKAWRIFDPLLTKLEQEEETRVRFCEGCLFGLASLVYGYVFVLSSVLVYVCARECVEVCRCSSVVQSPIVWSHAVVILFAVPVGVVSANVTQCLDWDCPIKEWILLCETHPNDPASHRDRYT